MLYKLLSSQRRDLRHSVISVTAKGSLRPLIQSLGVPVFDLGMSPGRLNLAGLATLPNLVRKLSPSILQGWMYHGNIAASIASIAVPRSSLAWNIRHSIHNIGTEKRTTRMTIALGAKLSGMTSVIVYNAHRSMDQHCALGYKGKSIIIPNGFDTTTFRPDQAAREQIRHEISVDNDAIVIGLAARFHPDKDHSNFLEAASVLHQTYPDVHYVLVGRGVDRSNKDLIVRVKTLGLGQVVHLLGERTDIARVMAAMDIATSSSRTEAFSNTVGEAMACAVPCVVTDVGDSARLVGSTGRVVPPRNHHALAKAWQDVLALRGSDHGALRAAARERIMDNFSIDAIVDRYRDMYLNLEPQR